jgi:2-C-methyl-D-erythritol 4-phosphate cytidylyltransferase
MTSSRTSSGDGPQYWAVVPAAGSGARVGADLPKQYLPVNGHTVIEHTCARLSEVEKLSGIVVVVAPGDPHWPAQRVPASRPVMSVEGGAERHLSVLNGLRYLAATASPNDWVLVHDAARPCVRRTDIDKMIVALSGHEVGGLLAVPVRDTMKRVNTHGDVIETVDRGGLWHALTPQMFRLDALTRAIEAAVSDGLGVTDEASAMEYAGFVPRVVEGSVDNIKITRREDLHLAALYIQAQEDES